METNLTTAVDAPPPARRRADPLKPLRAIWKMEVIIRGAEERRYSVQPVRKSAPKKGLDLERISVNGLSAQVRHLEMGEVRRGEYVEMPRLEFSRKRVFESDVQIVVITLNPCEPLFYFIPQLELYRMAFQDPARHKRTLHFPVREGTPRKGAPHTIDLRPFLNNWSCLRPKQTA